MHERVCILTTVHAPFDNRVFHKEAKTLASAGYEVILIAQHNCEEVVDGIRIVPLPHSRNRFDRMTRLTLIALRLAVKHNADVYHFHDPELIPVGLVLRLCQKTVIYDVHEDVPSDVQDKDWIPGILRTLLGRLMKSFERQASRWFSAIVTADEEIATRFRDKQERVVIIHNYPILEEFPSDWHIRGSRFSSGHIASFGGISSERSIHSIVRAMEYIPEESGCHLVLCGSCDSEAALHDVSRMPGWRRVDYRGSITRGEMLKLLCRASIAIVLYSPLQNHAGIRSNRLYEAMAAELPVITSNFPKWQAFISETKCGIAVDPSDAHALARAILYLHSHPNEAASMGLRGREAVLDRFSWSVEAPKFLRLYAELLHGVHGAQVTDRKGDAERARQLETLPPILGEVREKRRNENREARSLRDPLKG